MVIIMLWDHSFQYMIENDSKFTLQNNKSKIYDQENHHQSIIDVIIRDGVASPEFRVFTTEKF